MGRTSSDPNSDIITVRLPPTLRKALGDIAAEEGRPVGALLRDLIRERVRQKEHREFAAEARRQSLAAAALASDPNSDEAAVLRELDANFDEFARDLAAGEAAAEAGRTKKWR